MEILWFVILCFMLVTYFVLDGFDFGAGIIHLFFAKREKEKKQVMRAIGPFWDGNEVWLIASGGVLFMAFPTLYASTFSGFYLPLIVILWLFIFRALGIEFAHLIPNKLWEIPWQKAFGVSSLLLPLLFGIAFGNVIRGVNLGGVEKGIVKYEHSYSFFTPLWSHSFSPFDEVPGVIDWFTVTIGIVAVLTLLIHGTYWIILKTENNEFTEKLRKKIPYFWSVLLVCIVVSLLADIQMKSFNTIFVDRSLFFYVLLAVSGIALAGMLWVSRVSNKKGWLGFLFSTLFIISGIGTTVASIFPEVLPSTNKIVPSLTIYNTVAEDYNLEVGIIWWVIAIILVLIYSVFVHTVYRGKLTDKYDHY